jgi:hypothetical protein
LPLACACPIFHFAGRNSSQQLLDLLIRLGIALLNSRLSLIWDRRGMSWHT